MYGKLPPEGSDEHDDDDAIGDNEYAASDFERVVPTKASEVRRASSVRATSVRPTVRRQAATVTSVLRSAGWRVRCARLRSA